MIGLCCSNETNSNIQLDQQQKNSLFLILIRMIRALISNNLSQFLSETQLNSNSISTDKSLLEKTARAIGNIFIVNTLFLFILFLFLFILFLFLLFKTKR